MARIFTDVVSAKRIIVETRQGATRPKQRVVWVCTLACGHVQERSGKERYMAEPTKLECRACADTARGAADHLGILPGENEVDILTGKRGRDD